MAKTFTQKKITRKRRKMNAQAQGIYDFLRRLGMERYDDLSPDSRGCVRTWNLRNENTNPQISSVVELANELGFDLALVYRDEVNDV